MAFNTFLAFWALRWIKADCATQIIIFKVPKRISAAYDLMTIGIDVEIHFLRPSVTVAQTRSQTDYWDNAFSVELAYLSIFQPSSMQLHDSLTGVFEKPYNIKHQQQS